MSVLYCSFRLVDHSSRAPGCENCLDTELIAMGRNRSPETLFSELSPLSVASHKDNYLTAMGVVAQGYAAFGISTRSSVDSFTSWKEDRGPSSARRYATRYSYRMQVGTWPTLQSLIGILTRDQTRRSFGLYYRSLVSYEVNCTLTICISHHGPDS